LKTQTILLKWHTGEVPSVGSATAGTAGASGVGVKLFGQVERQFGPDRADQLSPVVYRMPKKASIGGLPQSSHKFTPPGRDLTRSPEQNGPPRLTLVSRRRIATLSLLFTQLQAQQAGYSISGVLLFRWKDAMNEEYSTKHVLQGRELIDYLV